VPEQPNVSPDTRDWTFVIHDGCNECGFLPQDAEHTGTRLRAAIPLWRAALSRDDVGVRPGPTVWSALEYGCHVRDTCRIFRQRLELMLAEDNPVFANWDQDATALEDNYFGQDAARVAEELAVEAETTADVFDSVRADQLARPGRRSNGSVFTVGSFAVYFLHDVEHHLHDVAG
jgi:hypothetical protein